MSTSSAFMELSSETNTIVVDAFTTNYRRQVAYAKNVWGIVSRPYGAKDLKINVAETIERFERIADLTMADFETSAKSTIELAEKIVAQAEKAREESIEAARALAHSGVKTFKAALETTEVRLDTLTKRLEDSIDDVVAGAPKKVAKGS